MGNPGPPLVNGVAPLTLFNKTTTIALLVLRSKPTMRYRKFVNLAVVALTLFSCKKEDHTPVVPPPVPPPVPSPVRVPAILLKEIDITGQAAHFYQFAYNGDSTISRAGFASGLALYDVFYSGNRIAEMRDFTPANKDTLRYVYDGQGKLSVINIIDNNTHVIFRRFVFTFDGDKLIKMERDQVAAGIFSADNEEQFDYYPDGNLKTKIGLLHDISGDFSDTTRYEQYDDKVNVDDFGILNGSVNEHLFLFQGFRSQKNNPGKVTFTQPSGLNNSITTYAYTYNGDGTPSERVGDIFTNGTGAASGLHVPFTTSYSYY